MAKKTSRQVTKTGTTTNEVAPATAAPRTTLSSRSAPALPDYSYVRQDLRRIGILAGCMFAGMIVLYFILPYILPLYAR
jgi:hypothetical protein